MTYGFLQFFHLFSKNLPIGLKFYIGLWQDNGPPNSRKSAFCAGQRSKLSWNEQSHRKSSAKVNTKSLSHGIEFLLMESSESAPWYLLKSITNFLSVTNLDFFWGKCQIMISFISIILIDKKTYIQWLVVG